MDASAFSLCADNALHIIVFDFAEEGALLKVLCGDFSVGTVVRGNEYHLIQIQKHRRSYGTGKSDG